MKQGFAPVADRHTRLFLLGSLPGDRSLALGQYYGHRGNQFWKLVGALVDEPLPALSYDERLGRLLAHGIGLWDVFAAAHREGSADAAIRETQFNPLHRLRGDYPALEAIGFNGGRAAKDGRRLLGGDDGIALYDLPSSSGMAAIPFVDKLARWRAVARHLR